MYIDKAMIRNAGIVIVLIAAAALGGYFLHPSEPVPVATESKVTSETKSETKVAATSQLHTKANQESYTSRKTDTNRNTNKTGHTKKTTRVIEMDPVTGKIIKETNVVEDTTTGQVTTINKVENATGKVVGDTETTTNTSTVAEGKTDSNVVIEEKTSYASNSKLGVMLTHRLDPGVTYDLKKRGSLAIQAGLLADRKNKTVKGPLLSIAKDIKKDGRYFANVYGAVDVNKVDVEAGVGVGVRF